MRRVRYQVACSLDGFIAGPDGGYDWIPDEPEFDFAALNAQFDTLLIGRRTYQELPQLPGEMAGKKLFVFSGSLLQHEHPEVTIVNGDLERFMTELRGQPGKDIWLYGGGILFRSLLLLNQVDTVEPAIVPVLLGGGRPLLPDAPGPRRLLLSRERVYRKSGIVLLEYRVENDMTLVGGHQPL